jgi:hypothetical protein
MLGSAVFLACLGFYGLRRRLVPDALPFGLLVLFATLWGMGAALQSAATDLPDKIFWSKSQIVWSPRVVASRV